MPISCNLKYRGYMKGRSYKGDKMMNWIVTQLSKVRKMRNTSARWSKLNPHKSSIIIIVKRTQVLFKDKTWLAVYAYLLRDKKTKKSCFFKEDRMGKLKQSILHGLNYKHITLIFFVKVRYRIRFPKPSELITFKFKNILLFKNKPDKVLKHL